MSALHLTRGWCEVDHTENTRIIFVSGVSKVIKIYICFVLRHFKLINFTVHVGTRTQNNSIQKMRPNQSLSACSSTESELILSKEVESFCEDIVYVACPFQNLVRLLYQYTLLLLVSTFSFVLYILIL